MRAWKTHLSVLVGELEGIDETESLVYATANREIVDGNLENRCQSLCHTRGAATG